MSNLLANYAKTSIYKIQCKDESISDIYIGHTTNFKQRNKLTEDF
jgi:predicted GIY-YIG superfamily endonuclease